MNAKGETARIHCDWRAIQYFFAVGLVDRLCFDTACFLLFR